MCDLVTDLWVSLSVVWPRARKEHRCNACRETIKPGDRYRREGYVFDGYKGTNIHCRRCWEIIEALLDKCEPDEGIDFDLDCGEVWEDPPEDVAALAFALPKDFTEVPNAT